MNLGITFHKHDLPDDYWKGYNKLRQAIRDRDKELVLNLINQGVRVNAEYQHLPNRTPLHLAVISRCPEIINLLLTKGADIGAEDWNSDTPLTLAAKMANQNLVDMLMFDHLKNHQNTECFSHLHVACMMNRCDIVRKLVIEDHARNINKAVSKNSIFWPGYTPLHFAVYYGSNETVECLLNMGANMMAEDFRKVTPLHLAYLQENEKIVGILLEAHKHEFKNSVNQYGLSHFHIACSRDNTSVVEHFLEMEVDVNQQVSGEEDSPWQNCLPIHLAIYHGCPKVIKRLVEAGAYLHYNIAPFLINYAFVEKNDRIYTLIIDERPAIARGYNESEKITEVHKACIENDMERVHIFLNNLLADPSFTLTAPICLGLTVLHLAVKYNCKEAVEFLLDQEADVLAQDSNGETPIHIAFRYRFDNIFHLMLGNLNGRTKNLTDRNGLSIFHLLCTTDGVITIENFIKTGIDVNAQVESQSICWSGFTALHYACLNHQTEVVGLLLKHNAHISMRNGMNLSPLDLVMRNLNSKLSSKIDGEFVRLITSIPENQVRKANIRGISHLHAFCISRVPDLEMMQQYVLSHKQEIDNISNLPKLHRYHKCTPLHFAVIFQNLAQAQLLLKSGANPLVVNDEGKTPLEYMLLADESLNPTTLAQNCFMLGKLTLRPHLFHVACTLRFSAVVEYVLNTISDERMRMSLISCKDDCGRTPLHSVSFQPNSASKTEVVRLLLKNGANVHAQDCQLETPLHAACSRKDNDYDVISLLLKYGSDVNAQNVFGETPLHLLFAYSVANDKRVLELLLDGGSDIEVCNECGLSCFLVWEPQLFRLTIDDVESFLRIRDCMITCVKHAKKLDMIRESFNKEAPSSGSRDCYSVLNRYLDSSSFDQGAFVDECKKELDSMGAEHIDRYTTLRDILGKSSHDMIAHCENVHLKVMLEEKSFSQKYPIYGVQVKLQLKNGKIRRQLLIDSRKSLMNMIGMNLPQLCSESIFQYLDNKDLQNIILGDRKEQKNDLQL